MDDYIHIPKTSGSSIRTILTRQYGVDAITSFEPGNHALRGRDPIDVLKDDLAHRDVQLITGHHGFGLHARIYKKLRYFSVVRDPILRAASDYYFAFSYEHHRLRKGILDGVLTPEAFLIEGRHAAPFDVQCRLLAAPAAEGTDCLALALETISRSFAAVGICEMFDESLLLIAKRLGWRPPLYSVRNVTRLPPELQAARRRIEAKVRTFHSDRYAADLALHASITARLKRDIAREGALFLDALSAFRELQRLMSGAEREAVFARYEFAATDQLPPLPPYVRNSSAYRTIEEYLTSPSSLLQLNNYVGHVDLRHGRVISGWAADLFSQRPIEVTVLRRGQQIGCAIANNPRPDVARACAIRSDVGFVVHLDQELASDPHDIRVNYENSGLSIA